MGFLSNKRKYSILRCRIILFCLLLLTHKALATGRATNKGFLSDSQLNVSCNNGLLSLDARGAVAEDIFSKLSETCELEIRNFGRVFTFDPVNINVEEMVLQKGIKKIIKIMGIKNYAILYNGTTKGNSKLSAINFLGASSESQITELSTLKLSSKAANNKLESNNSVEREEYSQDYFLETLEVFKEKYLWEDDEIQELASYILERMPERTRNTGLTSIIEKLDKKMEKEAVAIDEEMFLEVVEGILPPVVAPKMMNKVKKHINEFKGEEMYEVSEEGLTVPYLPQ